MKTCLIERKKIQRAMDTGLNNTTINMTYNVSINLHHVIITGTSSGLSILGAIVIFAVYFTIPEVRNFTRMLLLYLTMADVLTAVGVLIAVGRYMIENYEEGHAKIVHQCPPTDNDDNNYNPLSVCVIQSFITTFSNLASFLWTATLAFHLWSSVILYSECTEMLQTQIIYHVICLIIPFAIVFALLVRDQLGEDFCYGTGLWCGIRSSNRVIWARYTGDIAWQITCYLIAALLYIHLKFYLKLYCKGQTLAMVAGRLRNEDENFLFIWIVIYLLKLWGIIRFYIMMYTSEEVLSNRHLQKFLDFLLTMQSYGTCAQAFWNCIVFCFLKKTVRDKIKARFGCAKPNLEITEPFADNEA